MANKMLIDAAHPEETRVVVVRGNRVEEFDFEAANRKQLRGNIYLAKVTRVEPSLQAAFVDYGGNRHGFLAFSEIHPDYYQIPVADRLALLEEDEADDADDDNGADDGDSAVAAKPRKKRRAKSGDESNASAAEPDEADQPEPVAEESEEAVATVDDAVAAATSGEDVKDGDAEQDADEQSMETASDTDSTEDGSTEDGPTEDGPDGDGSNDDEPGPAAKAAATSADDVKSVPAEDVEDADDDQADADASESDDEDGDEAEGADNDGDDDSGDDDNGGGSDNDQVESVGAEDALEEVPERGRRPRRQYKIQEVIRRRQVILVQVVKEERGNKGAALTTYLSLAGRYSVLMPNTARGGGISRKITNPTDRKRLKKIATDLAVPEGMGVILRTAGASRTKAEIKRDFEYLLRLWESVRDLTLQSSAPSLVYEEGSLIKRSIRDLYNKDINEVLVAGDEGYREAKDFMRMLMPSHAKNVQPYRDATPIFTRNGVESQLDAMFSPEVTLPSGGYIVINQTEALVAIDVNSGRATREHNIEDTALATNLEAAAEVARQLRLRDLAGLIVIDFIDMEEKRNNRSVERKLKECLKSDRARIQVGRISHFGLLEMSRQRIRTGVLESSTEVCPHCQGSGTVRSTESVALHVLRALEDHLMRGVKHHLRIRTRAEVALYILNQKRPHLADLEQRFGLTVTVSADEMINGEHYLLERGDIIERTEKAVEHVMPDQLRPDDLVAEDDTEEEDEGQGRRKRRRRRRRKPSSDTESQEVNASRGEADASEDDGESLEAERSDGEDGEPRRRRRRGRRGGRRSRRNRSDSDTVETTVAETGNGVDQSAEAGEAEPVTDDVDAASDGADQEPVEAQAEAPQTLGEEPVQASETESEDVGDDDQEPVEAVENDGTGDEAVEEAELPAASEEPEAEAVEDVAAVADNVGESPAPTPPAESDGEPESKRSGWWQRRSFF